MKASVLHYGVGNVFSVEKAFRTLGFEVEVGRKVSRGADCLVLPGVGSFQAAAEDIATYRDELVDVIKSGLPVLGICLGMQVLFEESEEGPGRGLAVFKGRVVSLPDTVKKPHMGWNKVRGVAESRLLEGVGEGWVYFNHTYYPDPADVRLVLARTSYGVDFPSVVGSGNVFGTQFHPEKSSATGLKILRNFRELVRV
ncbi:MAG: imidazole glycerol phosphate synthase subunit HisH [Candidatus Caldarchaeum sp.]|nr:imidazole glycerol phosphate synthase subunit HisH [Candidatus Caldarchaeum sp.]MDW8359111.1 imidazole glycerol phosphate synthase subunit HisH [Candidatus Caldarchaeum sp.]